MILYERHGVSNHHQLDRLCITFFGLATKKHQIPALLHLYGVIGGILSHGAINAESFPCHDIIIDRTRHLVAMLMNNRCILSKWLATVSIGFALKPPYSGHILYHLLQIYNANHTQRRQNNTFSDSLHVVNLKCACGNWAIGWLNSTTKGAIFTL